MIRLYLITGFLGAGKTTFLKNFTKLLSPSRLHLIINEFGREGVDGALVRQLGSAMDEINNGSIFCSCRLDRFEEVLQKAQAQGPDIIIVEASGLSNPLNVKKILNQPDRFGKIQYEGCICLVDACRFQKVYETASAVKKQLAVSDMILINKTDIAGEAQLAQVRSILHRHRPDIPIHETAFGRMAPDWFAQLTRSGADDGDFFQTEDITLRKYTLYLRGEVSLDQLQKFLEMFLEDTYRIKGFVKSGGRSYLIDCVGSMYHQQLFEEEIPEESFLVVLSGAGLPVKKGIRTAMEWYPEMVERIE